MTGRGSAAEIWTALGLASAVAVALGFSRFAYALLLPPMQATLGWSYVEAGGMNTANGVGYIFGAALAARVSHLLGISRAFLVGMGLSAVALVLTGLLTDYRPLFILRALAGAATAVAFITGASLATSVSPGGTARRAALLVALYICGGGFGVIASGLIVPPVLAVLGPAGWRAGWLAMGGLSFLALLPAALAVRRVPSRDVRDSGLLPWREARLLAPTFASYALFGAGYVSYMTFVILLLRQNGAGAATTAAFWIVLGASSVAGTLVWGRILAEVRAGLGPGLVSLALLLGTLPILVSPTLPAAFLSAALFGFTFMSGPMSITILVRRLLTPALATAAISALTVAFALGQAAGPVVSGTVSDLTGSLATGLWSVPLLLALSAAAAPLQRSWPIEPKTRK